MGVIYYEGKVAGEAADLYREGYLREGAKVTCHPVGVSTGWLITEDDLNGWMKWKYLGNGVEYRVNLENLIGRFAVIGVADQEEEELWE